MDSICPNPESPRMATCFAEGKPQELSVSSNFLYQAATVLGILLFLISF
jgi:hypothetical protein